MNRSLSLESFTKMGSFAFIPLERQIELSQAHFKWTVERKGVYLYSIITHHLPVLASIGVLYHPKPP